MCFIIQKIKGENKTMKPAQTVLKKGNLLLLILMLFISMTSFHQPAQAAEPLTVGVLAGSDVEGNNVNIHVQTNLPNKMKFSLRLLGQMVITKK